MYSPCELKYNKPLWQSPKVIISWLIITIVTLIALIISIKIQAASSKYIDPFGRFNNQEFMMFTLVEGNVFVGITPHIRITVGDDVLKSFASAYYSRTDMYLIRDNRPILELPQTTNDTPVKYRIESFISGVLENAEPGDIISNYDHQDRNDIILCIKGNFNGNL